MSKKLFAKYYQENKEKIQKKAPERYQNLSKEENEKKKKHPKKKKKHSKKKKKKKKKKNTVVKVTKIFQKMKKIHWLSIEKKNKMSRNASL